MMDFWTALLDVLILLSVAFVLGAICERLRQSAIVGYLLAGTILGPNAFHVITNTEEVEALSELGVALLLFTIGLEFSWKRFLRMGATALGGGTLQVGITIALGASTALLLGQSMGTAIALGAVLSLSSTGCALRVLSARAEMDSLHGRNALGILLLQDLAVVALVVLVSVLSEPDSGNGALVSVLQILGTLGGMVVAFYLLFNHVVPHIVQLSAVRSNRELPILLAVVSGLGSAWVTHALGLSPAIGAFLAGMLLAESPFAAQIRADIAAVRTVLMTLFFSSIGMLADPGWMLSNWALVLIVLAAVVFGKALIVWGVLRVFRQSHVTALATGLCLAQVGEFSFVLAETARPRLIGEDTFQIFVSVMTISLFLTPFLAGGARSIASMTCQFLSRMKIIRDVAALEDSEAPSQPVEVLVVGFGPSGEEVVASISSDLAVTILDLNPELVEKARRGGHAAYLGDADYAEVLEHLRVTSQSTVVITLPDPKTAENVIRLVRSVAPQANILARARYNRHAEDLRAAGADTVLDEETEVGKSLARTLSEQAPPEDASQGS